MIELSTHESMRALGERDYSALLRDDTPPFLSFAFLDALESVGRRSPLGIPSSPSDAARKALQEIELARVSPRMPPN